MEQLDQYSGPPAVHPHHDECLHSTLSGYTQFHCFRENRENNLVAAVNANTW